MRRLGFGSAIAVGAVLLAGSLQGMAGIDDRLQAASERPQVRQVFVSERVDDCPWKGHSEDRVEL
jgi:hypothetical protein